MRCVSVLGMTTTREHLDTRYQTIAETGPGFAVLGDDNDIKPGRWATHHGAHQHGVAGRYLLTGVCVVEVPTFADKNPGIHLTDQVIAAATRITAFLARITALDTPRTPLGQFSTLAPALSALASLNADAEDRARIAVALIRYDNAMCPGPADDAEIDYCSGVPLLHSDIQTLLFAHEI